MMKQACLAIPFALFVQGAHAANTTGATALALAALTGEHEAALGSHKRHVLARLFDGHTVVFPAGHTITVTAAKIVCRISDVAIARRSCALTFGAHDVNLSGRRANELYATLVEAGVPGDGAAGSIFESVSALSCVIDPNVVLENAGGGASCTFTPGP